MQDQQVGPPARRDRVGTALVVAQLHEQNLVINVFDDRADLAACKPLSGNVRQQRHHVQQGRLFGIRFTASSQTF